MRAELETGEAVIADSIEKATGFIDRLRGLMYVKHLPKGHAILLEPCNSIHTFGMRFAIDVLFLDASSRILKAVRSLTPGKIAGPIAGACAVLEANAGSLPINVALEGKRLRFIE